MAIAAAFNDGLWAAVADPSRRRLIDALLRSDEATATTLAQTLPITRQAIAKHLSILQAAGLVRRQRRGKEVRFSLQADALRQAAGELSEAAQLWDRRLQKIKRIAEHIHQQHTP